LTNNVSKYNYSDSCPVCTNNTVGVVNLRSIEAMVRVHKDRQFPITLTHPEKGYAMNEIPLCEDSVNFFGDIPKEGKKVIIYCQDL